MTPPQDDAIFEFPAEDEPGSAEGTDDSDKATDPPDGIFREHLDARTVSLPVQNDIDVLVDATSAGGRPRLSSESDIVAEADDADDADDAESSDLAIVQYGRDRSNPSLFQPNAVRYLAGFVGAFAFGALIAWSVLRSFDAASPSVAVHPPVAAEHPLPRPVAPVTPESAAPAQSASVPSVAAPIAPPATPSTPSRAATAAPAIAPRPGSAVAPAPRAATTETVSPGRNAAPAAPVAIVPPNLPSLAKAPVAAVPRVEVAPKNIADGGAVSLPGSASASAIIAPPPVAAAASAAANSLSAMALEQSAVLQTVKEYTQAYSAMDVVATAAVWPSVNRRALARAYSTLKSQELDLEDCKVAITDTSATTRCRGTVEYVRKIGNPTPRTGYQDVVFRMRKLGGDWFIDDVRASELDVAKR